MKQTLLIITAVMLVVGFTSGQEPIDGSTLVYKDDLMYAPGSDKPYSGVAVWYNSGQKEYESTFKDGERNGLQTWWYDNGQKSEEKTYKDGKLDGLYTEWYSNGQKKRENTYKDGKPDGLITWWFDNGQKSEERTYKDGELIEETYWDRNGNKN